MFPLVALAEGKNATALALIRTGGAAAPAATVRPAELDRRIVAYRQLRADPTVALPDRSPARTITLKLTGTMMNYDWRFNGKPFDQAKVEHIVSTANASRLIT